MKLERSAIAVAIAVGLIGIVTVNSYTLEPANENALEQPEALGTSVGEATEEPPAEETEEVPAEEAPPEEEVPAEEALTFKGTESLLSGKLMLLLGSVQCCTGRCTRVAFTYDRRYLFG